MANNFLLELECDKLKEENENLKKENQKIKLINEALFRIVDIQEEIIKREVHIPLMKPTNYETHSGCCCSK